eukprot:TRINITY_DN57678_c0_g1_i1.p1 TRINITY_DN57678_c0_g1~~TRINITY_DN57678_c0_g1_i1.p1  ORF type:complete len:562 (-),score=106.65 TRINITY_DN57678_c0_g1_i1:33-1718(-)
MASRRQEQLEFEANDYYAFLNLDSTASEADVRRNFRKLALAWHPDKHVEGPEKQRATSIFQQISKANEVLSDKDQRNRYDTIWKIRHQFSRVVPEWALKVGRAGSVESARGDSVPRRAGSIDRCASVAPEPCSRQCPSANDPTPGHRFSSGPSTPFVPAFKRPASRPPPQSSPRSSKEDRKGRQPKQSPRESTAARDSTKAKQQETAAPAPKQMPAAAKQPPPPEDSGPVPPPPQQQRTSARKDPADDPTTRPSWATWRNNSREDMTSVPSEEPRRKGSLGDARRAAASAARQREQYMREAEFMAREREAKKMEAEKEKSKFASATMRADPRESVPRSVPQMNARGKNEQPEEEAESFWAAGDYVEEVTRRRKEKQMEEREQQRLSEMKIKMAKQAQDLAAKAQASAAEANTASRSSVSSSTSNGGRAPVQTKAPSMAPGEGKVFAFVPEGRSSGRISSSGGNQPPSAAAAAVPAAQKEENFWSSLGAAWESPTKADAQVAPVSQAGAGISDILGAATSWFSSGPIREEAKPVPESCPKCGRSMPKSTGANFCPRCRHIMS